MKHLHTLTFLLLTILGLTTVHAERVPFKSGEEYQIRCIEIPGMAVAPQPDDDRAIYCVPADNETTWWRITKFEEGRFILFNTSARRYMTYDGIRSANRRYTYLSTTDHGNYSRWRIYMAKLGMGIQNVGQSNHYLNVRRGSLIVGTYPEPSFTLSPNERFVLVNRSGKVVNEWEGQQLYIPAECYQNEKKGLATASSTVTVNPQSGTVQKRRSELLDFTVNHRRPAHEYGTDKYLFSIPEAKLKGSVEVHLQALNPKDGKLFANGKAVPKSGKVTISDPGRAHYTRLALTNDEGDTIASARLQFTALPIVEITTSHLSKSYFTKGSFHLIEPSLKFTDSTLTASFRHRGDFTTLMSKKSYGVKFTDATGRKQDRSLPGMRTDNYWILDALAVDPARLRNRVAMDLWSDMATPPYFAPATRNTARTAVSGCMVEVYENGAYKGIYNLSERIDRKQLQLVQNKKQSEAKGCLYKSTTWDTWTLMGANPSTGQPVGHRPPQYDNSASRWSCWESKYPEPKDGKLTDWKPLYEACELVATASDKDFIRRVGEVFDLPVLVDYYLFVELLHAVDNTGKNMHWAVYDASQSRKLTPVPWDLDGTFGRDWNGSSHNCHADNNYRLYLLGEKKQSALFERLYKLNACGWNNLLAERYRTLRRTLFEPDALYRRFAAYHTLMKDSGAEHRERRKWGGSRGSNLDFDAESAYLKSWLKARIQYLDQQYDYR